MVGEVGDGDLRVDLALAPVLGCELGGRDPAVSCLLHSLHLHRWYRYFIYKCTNYQCYIIISIEDIPDRSVANHFILIASRIHYVDLVNPKTPTLNKSFIRMEVVICIVSYCK